MNDSISAPARLESMEELREFAAAHAARFGCTPKRVREVTLAVEEALVNVFSHAYGSVPGEVSIACREREGNLLIEISDSGKPFDPVAFIPHNFTDAAEARKIGGRGILIIRRYADGVAYERTGPRNVLTLRFTRKHTDA